MIKIIIPTAIYTFHFLITQTSKNSQKSFEVEVVVVFEKRVIKIFCETNQQLTSYRGENFQSYNIKEIN